MQRPIRIRYTCDKEKARTCDVCNKQKKKTMCTKDIFFIFLLYDLHFLYISYYWPMIFLYIHVGLYIYIYISSRLPIYIIFLFRSLSLPIYLKSTIFMILLVL